MSYQRKFDMVKSVNGSTCFVRDGAGKLYSFDGVKTFELSAFARRKYVAIRIIQIKKPGAGSGDR